MASNITNITTLIPHENNEEENTALKIFCLIVAIILSIFVLIIITIFFKLLIIDTFCPNKPKPETQNTYNLRKIETKENIYEYI